MVRGTTPDIVLTVPESVDLSQATNVYATFSQIVEPARTAGASIASYNTIGGAAVTVTKSGSELTVDAHSVSVYLTQEESLAFAEHWVEVQLNWTDGSGRRFATKTARISISRQLLNEVVE